MNRSWEGLVPVIDFDLTAVVAIWMAGVLVLVPLLGLVARFGLTPLIEAVARLRSAGTGSMAADREAAVDERFASLEQRVAELTRTVSRLEAADAERHAPVA